MNAGGKKNARLALPERLWTKETCECLTGFVLTSQIERGVRVECGPFTDGVDGFRRPPVDGQGQRLL